MTPLQGCWNLRQVDELKISGLAIVVVKVVLFPEFLLSRLKVKLRPGYDFSNVVL